MLGEHPLPSTSVPLPPPTPFEKKSGILSCLLIISALYTGSALQSQSGLGLGAVHTLGSQSLP